MENRMSRSNSFVRIFVVVLVMLGVGILGYKYFATPEVPPSLSANVGSKYQGFFDKDVMLAPNQKSEFLGFEEDDIEEFEKLAEERMKSGKKAVELKTTSTNKGLHYLYSEEDISFLEILKLINPSAEAVVLAYWDAENSKWIMTNNDYYQGSLTKIDNTEKELAKVIVPAGKAFALLHMKSTEVYDLKNWSLAPDKGLYNLCSVAEKGGWYQVSFYDADELNKRIEGCRDNVKSIWPHISGESSNPFPNGYDLDDLDSGNVKNHLTWILLDKSKSSAKFKAPELESILPEKMDFVLAIDHRKGQQMDTLKALKNKFPERLDLNKKFIEMFNAEAVGNIDWTVDVEPILEGDWKLIIAAQYAESTPSTVTRAGAIDQLNRSVKYYVIFYSNEADEFAALMEKNIDEADRLSRMDGDLEIWEELIRGGVLMRNDDIFVASNDKENKLIENLKNKGNSDADLTFLNEVKSLKSEHLGYLVFDYGKLGELLRQEIPEELDLGSMRDFKTVWFAENDGLGIKSAGSLPTKGVLRDLAMKAYDYKRNLADKVVGQNVITYIESGGVDIDLLMDVFQMAGTSSINNSRAYDQGISEFSRELRLTPEELKKFISSPFALLIDDGGKYYPTLSFYLDVQDSLAAAENVNAYLDGVVEGFIEELSKDLVETEFGDLSNLLKVGEVEVNGQAMKRVYADWNSLDPTVISEISAFVDPEEINFEIFFGRPEEGVMAIALYPDFDEKYQSLKFSKTDSYKDLMSHIGTASKSITYFSIVPLFNIADNYLAVLSEEIKQEIPTEVMEQYNYWKKILIRFKYFGSGDLLNGNVMTSTGFLKIQ